MAIIKSTTSLTTLQTGADTFFFISKEDANPFLLDPNFAIRVEGLKNYSSPAADFGWVDSGMDIQGSDGHDRIVGTKHDDRVLGGDGHDMIAGGGGNDRIAGEAGDDRLFGEDGDDMLWGGAGHDQLSGGDGFDYLFGGSGNDVLDGDRGNDRLDGGSGNDSLFGDDMLGRASGHDFIDGGAGYDHVNYWTDISQASWTSYFNASGQRVTEVSLRLADGTIETDTLVNIEQINFGPCESIYL